MKIFRFFIAGLQFHQGVGLIRQDEIQVGTKLHLVREPSNIHDRFAIAIFYKDKQVGYVPKIINKQIVGAKAQCGVIEINKSAETWEMCKVIVIIDGDGESLIVIGNLNDERQVKHKSTETFARKLS